MSSLLISTLLSAGVLAFGIRNLCHYSGQIRQHKAMVWFYVFAFSTLICGVANIWIQIRKYKEAPWRLTELASHYTGICLSWCQTIQFLTVGRNLFLMEQQLMGARLNFEILNLEIKVKARRWLLFGLATFTAIFIGSLIWYIYSIETMDSYTLVIDECIWWTLNSVEVLLLLCTGLYTVHKMRDMFGDSFSKEAWLVTAITMIFCLC